MHLRRPGDQKHVYWKGIYVPTVKKSESEKYISYKFKVNWKQCINYNPVTLAAFLFEDLESLATVWCCQTSWIE